MGQVKNIVAQYAVSRLLFLIHLGLVEASDGHINTEKVIRKNILAVTLAIDWQEKKVNRKNMTGKTHRIGGALAGAIFIRLSRNDNLDMCTLVLTGSVLGSLLPDIDHPRSTISRKLWFISWPLVLLRGAMRQIASFLPKCEEQKVKSIVGHRGITHSLIACISLGCAMSGIGFVAQDSMGAYYWHYMSFAVGLSLGMVSHLCLDFVSNGIPLFCPVTNKRYGFKWIKTGSMLEFLVGIILVGILIILIGKESTTWIVTRH